MSDAIYTIVRAPKIDDAVPRATMSHTGWLEPCPVGAWAQVCHDGERIYVRLTAAETPVVARRTGKLAMVCNDSCLEFFFAPDAGDHRYFNFEFNPKGVMYLGFGGTRPTRVRQIVKDAPGLFGAEPFVTGDGWGIGFSIPLSFIKMYFPGFGLTGEMAGNFFKCGDETPCPHYLSWSPLTADTPDFHRRQDFGRLIFE